MPTKKKPAKSISPTTSDSAPTKTPAVTRRASGAKKPVSLDQKQRASSDSALKARARRAKAPNSKAEFDETHHHAEIAREAYLLWLGRGCGHGGDFEDWLHAIEIVRQRHLA